MAEATLIGLYDGGVLSPAVLERVIAGFSESAIDWHTPPARKSVDGKSLHEVVAMTMMPGRAIRNPSKEFLTIVEHVGGRSMAEAQSEEQANEQADEPGEESDGELMNQLAGISGKRTAARKKAVRTASKSAPSRAFNPLFHAAPPGRARKS